MMEFTISRVCMSVCGLILLASVTVPVMGIYESQASGMESDIPEGIAELIDNFYRSEMDVFIVPMSDIIPNSLSYVEFEGHLITLTTERGVHKSGTGVMMISDQVFGYGDILKMEKGEGFVTMERLI